ncbi:MAG: Mpo1-like protein, partial [Myxococcota bacterium]
MSDRIASFAAFYPWYLGEHEKPACRWLHFAGTSGFLGIAVYCLADRPLFFGPAVAVALGLGWAFFGLEGRRSAAPVLLGMIAILVAAHPGILGGIG